MPQWLLASIHMPAKAQALPCERASALVSHSLSVQCMHQTRPVYMCSAVLKEKEARLT